MGDVTGRERYSPGWVGGPRKDVARETEAIVGAINRFPELRMES